MQVEDGSGLPDAESYASIATVATYLEEYSDDTGWSSASTAVKERALRQASRFLDTQFRFIGVPKRETQRLQWPRAQAYDWNGTLLTGLPLPLIQACCELANRALTETLIPDQSAADIGKVSEMVKVGPITVSTENLGGASSGSAYPVVDGLLRPLLINDFLLERG